MKKKRGEKKKRKKKRGKQKTAQSPSASEHGLNEKQRDSNFEMSPTTFICSDMFRDADDKGVTQKTCEKNPSTVEKETNKFQHRQGKSSVMISTLSVGNVSHCPVEPFSNQSKAYLWLSWIAFLQRHKEGAAML